MKQHISPSQLMEIEDKEIVANWFPKSSAGYFARKNWHQYWCKKVTIGKMLELVHTKLGHIDNGGVEYVVTISDDITGYYRFRRKELCDALWECTKHMMK